MLGGGSGWVETEPWRRPCRWGREEECPRRGDSDEETGGGGPSREGDFLPSQEDGSAPGCDPSQLPDLWVQARIVAKPQPVLAPQVGYLMSDDENRRTIGIEGSQVLLMPPCSLAGSGLLT